MAMGVSMVSMRSLFWACGVLIGVLFLITCWLAWQNWASEKVRSSILPAFAIGTISALVTILFNLKSETKELEFPVVFIFDSDSKKPLELPVLSSLGPDLDSVWRYVEALKAQPSSSTEDKKTVSDSDLYFDILLRVTLDVLFETYSQHWDIKHRTIDLPYVKRTASWSQDNAPKEVKFISLDDIKELFPDVYLLKIKSPDMEKITLPIGTEILGEAKFGEGKQDRPFERKFSMTNNFVVITISLLQAGGGSGLGSFSHLLGLSQEESARFRKAIYIVRLSAKFEGLKSGHPAMPQYRRWVDIMFDQLQTNLDERKHWEKARDQFLLLRDRQRQKTEANQEEK